MAIPRVVLADDLPEMLERVTQLLGHDFDIVWVAHNGEQAVQAVATLNPDLLVLDISMPLLNGFQVASLLRQLGCRTEIVFLTVHEDQDYIEAAFSVEALGYVFKSRLASDLIPAVEKVLHGHRFTSSPRQSKLCSAQSAT